MTPFRPSKCIITSAEPVTSLQAPVAVIISVGVSLRFNLTQLLFVNSRNKDVFMTVFAHPLSCRALMCNLEDSVACTESLR